jgi:citrate lyase subunit beta/citryl-CoA lyase
MAEPRRSVLFTPGDEAGMMRKALESDADVVVFDLEDSVAPDAKDKARDSVGEVIGETGKNTPEVWVRLNPLWSGGDEDLESLTDSTEPSCFVIPKAESGEDIKEVAGKLQETGVSAGLVPILETSSGILNAAEIADGSRVSAVVFGAEDLCADLGARRTEDGHEVVYARQKVVTAAAAAGVDAVDTLWTEFKDTDGLREDTERGIGLGYDGKLAIHPTQVGVINDAFTPDGRKIEWAERIIEAKKGADEDGKGVFEVDGEMVDEPLVGIHYVSDRPER